MRQNNIASISEAFTSRAASVFDQPYLNINFIFFVVLLAYGYELFGFHLTIDEEIHADYAFLIKGWFEQGRWGMSALSALMPSTVVPTISPMLGISLSVLSWWWLLRNVYGLNNLAATLAVSIAITFPVLAFTVTFSTLAYGVGVANICLLIFAYNISKGRNVNYFSAALAGAFAISIYQTFSGRPCHCRKCHDH